MKLTEINPSIVTEMAASQVCAKCGKGPISKTHTWVVGSGWKCRGAKKEAAAPAHEKDEHAEERKGYKSHVSDEGAKRGLEHLYKKQKAIDTND